MAQENVLDGIWEVTPVVVKSSVSFGSALDAQIECLWRTSWRPTGWVDKFSLTTGMCECEQGLGAFQWSQSAVSFFISLSAVSLQSK